jgi:hypothetical protein
MWFGDHELKRDFIEISEENKCLKEEVKKLKDRVIDLEYDLNKAKNSIYFDKFKYTENDLVSDRRCYVPNDQNLRRIVVIGESWEVVKEEKGKFETPDMFQEYKKKLGTDKVSKAQLFEYLKDKTYIMEQGGYHDDTTGFKI